MPGRTGGVRKWLTSEKGRLDKPTPVSGPVPVFEIPGGKWGWMIKPAVRLVDGLPVTAQVRRRGRFINGVDLGQSGGAQRGEPLTP